MDTWLWITLGAVVAVALFVLAWRSSGRARPLSRGPRTSLTQEQIDLGNMNASQHQGGQIPG
jgi:hypothetical protein